MFRPNQMQEAAQTRKRKRRKGHDEQIPPYDLKEFIVAYLIAIAVFFVGAITLTLLSVPIYFVIGIALTRYISRRVVWNQHMTSLADVARTKMSTWLTWPISIPIFIWQIFIAHHL